MRTKFFISTVISVVLGLAMFCLALAISNKNVKQIDVTKNRRFTLSEQSSKAVQNLDFKVKAYAFMDPANKKKAEDLLNRYRRVGDKFEYEVIDPYKRPRTANKYGVKQAGTVVLEGTTKDAKAPRIEKVASATEQEITNALMRMTRTKEVKVYVITGHGERGWDREGPDSLSNFKSDLAKEGLILESLNLAEKKEVPEGAKVVVLAGPKSALLPGEEKALRAFLDKQGSLFMLLEPESPDSYSKLAAEYGFTVPNEIIIDEASQLLGAEPIFAVAMQYDMSSPITKDFKQHAVFRLARPVKTAANPPAGAKVNWLAQTAPTAFTVPAEMLGQELRIDPSKTKHEVVQMAAAGSYPKASATPTPMPTPGVEPPKNPETRIVVAGDSDFLTDSLFRQVGNRDFALNILNWLGESENQISIRPTDPESTPLRMTQSDIEHLFMVHSLLIPFGVAVVGLVLGAYRRR